MHEKDKSMTKEEEVFEAFRHCISDPGCGRCPRKSDDCSKGIGHFEYLEKRLALDVVEMLKDALKKHDPVKPCKEHSGGGMTWWNVCGSCRTAINPNDKFCHECGRAVKGDV